MAKRDLVWFARSIDDRQVLGLLWKVWNRLPAYDRAVLRALCLDVVCPPWHDDMETIGSASVVDPDSWPDEDGIMVCREEAHTVSIHGVSGRPMSDAAAMAVIAHELAHVVLRHCSFSVTIGMHERLSYNAEELELVRRLHEDHCWLQVWQWGFRDEVKAAIEEFPHVKPSWYECITVTPLSSE